MPTRLVRAVLLAALLTACTPATLAGTAPQVAPFGYVEWDCRNPRPYAWIRDDVLDTPIEAGIRAHERSHVAVILAVSGGDCRRWQGWRASTANRLALEAMGFCAQVRAETPTRWSSTLQGAAYYGAWLAHPYYGFGITPEQAAELIALACES